MSALPTATESETPNPLRPQTSDAWGLYGPDGGLIMALPSRGEADAYAGFLGWIRRNIEHRDVQAFPNRRAFVVLQPDAASATYAFHPVGVVPQPQSGHTAKLLRVAALALAYAKCRISTPGPACNAAWGELCAAAGELL